MYTYAYKQVVIQIRYKLLGMSNSFYSTYVDYYFNG
jgi:hypothetical protein